jgi:hypothetical protein
MYARFNNNFISSPTFRRRHLQWQWQLALTYVQTPKKASDTIADFPSVQHEQNFGTRGERKKKYRCRGFSSF